MKKTGNWKQRLRYWFDNRMSKGTMELIRLLSVTTVLIVAVLSGIILLCGLSEEGTVFEVVWESFSTVINAWMPSAEDGEAGYVILMSLAALAGLLVTSVLIGIVSSAIEEKITALKQGNSQVMESGHTVVLGFSANELTLLQQLILAAGDDPACIVVGGEAPRDEMEEQLRENLEIPKNVRIICRTVDVYDPASLRKCAPEEAKAVIVSVGRDDATVKLLLAMARLLEEAEAKTPIYAMVSGDHHVLPGSFRDRYNITMLRANDAIAKIIAHSCTQPGISGAFEQVLNYTGYDFYGVAIPEAVGMTFRELTLRMAEGTPVGILSADGRCDLCPRPDRVIGADERVMVFSVEKDSFRILKEAPETVQETAAAQKPTPTGRVGIVGVNSALETVLAELPEDVRQVTVLLQGEEEQRMAEQAAKVLPYAQLRIREGDPSDPRELEAFARHIDHAVVLSPADEDEDAADMQTIFRLLRLRDIRERNGLQFNITAEMRREANQMLVAAHDRTDFVVASNISALFLAQLSEEPDLYRVFKELLSNEGCEIFVRTAQELDCTGKRTTAQLRARTLDLGYVILGIMEDEEIRFDAAPDEELTLTPDTRLVVLGED